MERSRKMVEIVYPDKSIHKVIITNADVTNDSRVILSYYDLSNNMHASFSEIINVEGIYYNNPNPHEWNYYVHNFQAFDRNLSDAIINLLPKKIELYDEEKIEKNTPNNNFLVRTKEDTANIINEKDTEPKVVVSRYLTAIMYANRGESLMVKDNYSNLLPVFFTLPALSDEGSLIEDYRKMNIDDEDKNELLQMIDYTLGDKIDISTIPEGQRFELSSGNKYYINFASCDDEELFYQLASCDRIKVDVTVDIPKILYFDNLSSALHHELPLELYVNGTTIKYETNSSVVRKQVG